MSQKYLAFVTLFLNLHIFVATDNNCTNETGLQILQLKEMLVESFPACYINATKIAVKLALNIPVENVPDRPITEKNVTFLLYTRKNTQVPYIFGTFNVCSTINSSTFDPSKRTVLYVEGALNSYNRSVAPFVEGLLPVDDVNVIITNWDSYTFFDTNFTQLFTTPRLGPIVGKFANLLIKCGRGNPKKMFFIGFSVGGETVGLAAKTISHRIAKLISNEPQGNCFSFLPPELRVSKTDADFVQIIHCSPGKFGTPLTLVGDVTFYANGGYIQPQCQSCDISYLHQCSHGQCGKYFLQSLYNLDMYIGAKCNSYFQYEQHKCNCSDTAVMGYATPITARGKYYVNATLTGSTTCS